MSRQVPAGRLAILRRAFDTTVRDPGFLADAEKLQMSVYPVTGEESEAIVARMSNVSPAIAAKVRRLQESRVS